MQKLVSLVRSHLFIFVFIFIILGGGLWRILLWFMSKSMLPMLSYRSFIVSGFTFKSLIHFGLFLCMILGGILVSSFYAKSLSHVWLFVILWTISHQAPLSSGFSRQEYWSDHTQKTIYPNIHCSQPWVLALSLIFLHIFYNEHVPLF